MKDDNFTLLAFIAVLLIGVAIGAIAMKIRMTDEIHTLEKERLELQIEKLKIELNK